MTLAHPARSYRLERREGRPLAPARPPATVDAGLDAPAGGGGPGRRRRPELEISRPRTATHPRAARAFGIAIAVATAVCIAVQPAPDGAEPVARWWQDMAETVAMLTIVVAVYVLVRQYAAGARLGVAAGVAMVVETILCPTSNHHQLGPWIWVQAALSGLVLIAAVAYLAAERRA